MGTNKQKIALIIGGGPAGLTAAYEFLQQTDIKPIVIEKSSYLGGISRTVNYKGNRMDIGGHRFFSKSNRVMDWWEKILPIDSEVGELNIKYQNQHKKIQIDVKEIENKEEVFLIRKRVSHIYFRRSFFDYPIRLNLDTLLKLGFFNAIGIFFSYLKAVLFPIRKEKNLEDFFINRFGKRLYLTFFKSYTEKVWGKSCREISKEWGEQRIKGLSVRKAIAYFFKKNKNQDVETSLIESFLYPKYGPGQLWEKVGEIVSESGGEILMQAELMQIILDETKKCNSVVLKDHGSDKEINLEVDYVFSSMPVKELFQKLVFPVEKTILEITNKLEYRDIIVVGALLDQKNTLPDNWIYIQEPDVSVGRIQIFNNWSESLVADSSQTWIGMEYFCSENDAFWSQTDAEIQFFAAKELEELHLFANNKTIDSVVIRMKKAYPSYFGSYLNFSQVIDYLEAFDNLFLIGRNGMHKYNNQDHSMLTAMEAVRLIRTGTSSKKSLWEINTEESYHEEK